MANAEIISEPSTQAKATASVLALSVIIPTRNEAENLPRCLAALTRCREVYIIDSQSTDSTVEIARSFGAKVVQFYYQGGWPKKRQWALDTLQLESPWTLLLDADEFLTPELAAEIELVTQSTEFNGYWVPLRLSFLGCTLRHGDSSFRKLSLFRRGLGHFECRLQDQDASMGDMEVHEHVIVNGQIGGLKNALEHHNVNSLSRYIEKHNQYSNWDARLLLHAESKEGSPHGPANDVSVTHAPEPLSPSLWQSQAQRRRWLRKKFFHLPGSPILFFFYKYVFRLGFLDGVPGLIYCGFQGVQFFHIKAKLYELRSRSG